MLLFPRLWFYSIRTIIVLVRIRRKGNPHTLLMGMQIGVPTTENMVSLKKLEIELPNDAAFPLC